MLDLLTTPSQKVNMKKDDIHYVKREDAPCHGEDTEKTLLFFAIEWLKEAICLGHQELEKYKNDKDQINKFSNGEVDKWYIEENIPPELHKVTEKLIAKYPHQSSLMGSIISYIKPAPSRFTVRYFFLMALTQARRYLQRISEVNKYYLPIFSHFEKENCSLAEVRNINEHFDEHIVDSNNKQYMTRYRNKNYVLDKKRSSLSDATGASGIEDPNTGKLDIIIGNRISIQNSIESAEYTLIELLSQKISSIDQK